jgi:DNA-binding CsgD family transcriptional regulator
MAPSGTPYQTNSEHRRPMLLDRVDERASLDDLLDSARHGRSGVIVFEGDAGMGKTMLLEYAAESAGDLSVVRIVGVEAEQSFGFASLHRLLLPFPGAIEELPAPQRGALKCAFGLSTQSPADLFLVGLAALTLLADAAVPRGLLCVIDDAQWLDPESLQTMGFVGRRLGAEGIALVFGIRTPSDGLPALAGLRSLVIAGLPDSAASELLAGATPDPLDPDAVRRIVTETGGCPLALTELADELVISPRTGTREFFDPIPVGPRLEAHFRRQAEALSPEAQLFVLIAAVEGSGDVAMVRRVAMDLGCDAECEDEAVRARLLVTEPRLEFRHPLIRSAVYGAARQTDRVKVHRALASLINRDLQPDRWARHAVAIATGPDEGLARGLEAAAHQARERGGFATEAAMLTQAAEFSEDVSRRSERLLKAAKAATTAGLYQPASALVTEARPELADPLSMAQAQQLEGRLRIPLGQPHTAAALLLAAAQQFLTLDADLARESMLEAFDAFLISQHLTDGTTGPILAQAAQEIRRTSNEPELADRLLNATTLLLGSGYRPAVNELREAVRQFRMGPTTVSEITQWHNYGTWFADELLDDRSYQAWVDRVEATARDMGALDALSVALVAAANHNIRAGRFADAEANFVEAAELASARLGRSEVWRLLDMELHAWRGNEKETRRTTSALIEGGLAFGTGSTLFQAHRALAILHVGAGRYAAALDAAEYSTSRDALGWTSQSLHLVVEAGVRSGARGAAERALAELEMRAQASGTHWALGLLARSQALITENDTAEALYERAIAELEQCLVVTDLAHAHLVYGEWLRRQKRRLDARVQLRKACDMFETMGALGFSERTNLELAATGERARQRTPDKASELTPQERQIATLAGQGVKNSEIAAKLFISAHTVEYHLRKVFRKLNVNSRYELKSVL